MVWLLFGASYATPTWLFEASGAIAGPSSRYSSDERTVEFAGRNIDGIPSATTFIAATPLVGLSNGFYIELSTRKTLRFLEPGTYLLAERAGFESNSHPGLDVSIEGNGCNTLYGEFTVRRYELDSSAKPRYVDVSFSFLCGENQTVPTIGRFAYDAAGGAISFAQAQPAVPVPAASIASQAALFFMLLLFGCSSLRMKIQRKKSRR